MVLVTSPAVHNSPGCRDARTGPVATAAWRCGPGCVLETVRGCSPALPGEVLPPTLLCPAVLQILPARHRDC